MHCHYFLADTCRSCAGLSNPYEVTLLQKQTWLQSLFPETVIRDIVPTQQISGSRIRAKLAVFGSTDQPQLGFLNERREIVSVDQCPLHHARINQLSETLKEWIREARLVPWSMQEDRGELKFIVLTFSPTHEELMVQLVLRSREAVDRIRRLWKRHEAAPPAGVTVLSVNLQPVRSSLINGAEEIAISEKQRISVRYGETTVLYGPQSFVQTNYEIADRLYERARTLLLQEPHFSVLDLYCGTGVFSLTSVNPDAHILGADTAAASIACARESAAAGGFRHADFHILNTDQLFQRITEAERNELTHSGGARFDVAICNPPRAGMDPSARQLLKHCRPPFVLYSSCNPTTLARDIADLSEHYTLEAIEPFDMFPFTAHLECLAVLRRN
jgi:23S rRNA (uracil747-C5)-methyltransferase